jgi:hypothetical protein
MKSAEKMACMAMINLREIVFNKCEKCGDKKNRSVSSTGMQSKIYNTCASREDEEINKVRMNFVILLILCTFLVFNVLTGEIKTI